MPRLAIEQARGCELEGSTRMNNYRKHLLQIAALAVLAVANSAMAQPSSVDSVSAVDSKHSPSKEPIPVERECIATDGANVCWLRFSDGTRCVVANHSSGGDAAINCQFSTPMERLHRLPKD